LLIGDDKRLYVADEDTSTIQILDYDETNDTYVQNASAITGVNSPSGLAIRKKKVQKGKFLTIATTQKSSKKVKQISSIAFPENGELTEGELFILDLNGKGAVYALVDATESRTQLRTDLLAAITDAQIKADGDWSKVTVTEETGVLLQFEANTTDTSFELLFKPFAIEKGESVLGLTPSLYLDDQLLTTVNHKFCVIDIASSSALYNMGSSGTDVGQFNDPKHLTIDKNNNTVFIADKDNNRIQRFYLPEEQNEYYDLDLVKQSFGTEIRLAIASDGTKYISDDTNDKILIIDKYGVLQAEMTQASDIDLNNPKGIAIDSQRNIYVCDSGNDRIVKYDGLGNELATYGTSGTEQGFLDAPEYITIDAATGE